MPVRPDPTFHASPKLAMEAPVENFAYTALLSPDFAKPDALAVIDVKPGSPTYSQIVHTVTMPNKGDEFHHFGWNACSSALSPLTGHAFLDRRYLIIPGIRSSRIYIVDTKPDPTKAKIHKIIEPEEVFKKTGYSRPHTVHCGPEGLYVSTLGGGGKDGTDGPPGIFIMDCETFDILGRWEIDRGPQNLHYDFWWNLPRDYMVSSEWALPPQFENGIVPEDLLSNKYGHRIHFWDLRARRNVQTIDLGANHQMALEVRPAHDPVREYGFLGVVVDTTNLEGSIWTWWREGGKFHIEKTATIPPEPASKDLLPPLLQGFGAVPPLVTDIDLSMDDRFLYVACWGTGEMRQYDVTDPRRPKLAGSVHLGGIARRTTHPNGKVYAGGPQMVEISRDGKRVYWTNSLYSTWEPGTSDPARGRRLLDGFVLLSVSLSLGGLDTCRTLAGCYREWPLSRGEPGDGMAARGFSRADGTAFARRCGGTLAAHSRPSAGDARGDPSLLSAGRPRPMAATGADRCQSAGDRVRRLPIGQPAPSARAGADTTDATGTLVLCRGDRARRGIDAGADLSRSVPRRRSRHGSRGGRCPHQS
jgi:methanethiol oxidase